MVLLFENENLINKFAPTIRLFCFSPLVRLSPTYLINCTAFIGLSRVLPVCHPSKQKDPAMSQGLS